MPSRPTGGSSSESDSDVPESFSLAESKKSAKRKNEEIQKAHRAIKRQGKLKNQERDRTLKEQAKRRKESVNKERDDAVVDTPGARMERAMKEAQEEESGGGDSEGGEQDGFSGLGVEDEIASEDEDMASGESSSDGMDAEDEEVLVKKPPKHLPDHLFEVAFTSQNARLAEASNSPIRTSRKSKEAALSSKKKKRKEQSKDMVIGSRTIRTLSSTLQTSREGSYAPMPKAQRYIDRLLALKGGNSRARGWQRKPANIGVMRHDGPAANFMRS